VQKLRNEMFTDGYGFIVDYLAEVLKELRKEDHTHDYKQFFELSTTITTRDKDAIAKTFSGLIKVIHPHGEYTEAEAQELFDFAVELRKRVKEQLSKMDDTFEEVDFSYKLISSGIKKTIETLEVIEYLQLESSTGSQESSGVELPAAIEGSISKIAKEGQQIIRDNQTGISYDKLFGAYLEEATAIIVTDPYVRLPYQLRNFMEFAQLVSKHKKIEDEVKLHLITNNNEDFIENVRDSFRQIAESLEPLGIIFTYEFENTIHDRSIVLDNGWKIILGRGLDIFQKTGGWFDIAEYDQEKRQCKACEITYLWG
jgi:ATP-dependent Lon protease